MVYSYLTDWEGLQTRNKEIEMEVELPHKEKHGKNEDFFFLDWRHYLIKFEN